MMEMEMEVEVVRERTRSHAPRVMFQRAAVGQEILREVLIGVENRPGMGQLGAVIAEIARSRDPQLETELEQKLEQETEQSQILELETEKRLELKEETKEKMVALNSQIKTKKIAFPAPEGKECIMHFARDVCLFQKNSSASDNEYLYKGYLQEEDELFNWEFHMVNKKDDDCEDGVYSLRITEAPGRAPMNISMFQQAELLLQFYHVNGDENKSITLVHEVPTLRISLQPVRSTGRTRMNFENILPSKKLEEGVAQIGNQTCILLRLYVKLMKGELNVQHGIQKCFHPDKALYDLRERMDNLLVEGENADVDIISKDEKQYKVHRSILAANSDFYKNMFASGMKETKENRVNFEFGWEALKTFLKFIYGRNRLDLELSASLAIDVFRAADMYEVQLLKEACEETLLAMESKGFTLDEALTLFFHATTVGSPPLQAHAVQIILALGGKVSESKMFMEIAELNAVIVGKLLEMIAQFQKATTAT